MADLLEVAGWKIYIGPQIALGADDVVASDFTGGSPTYVEIDGWETMGAFGDTAQTITTALINRQREVKQKGTRNAGQMQNNFAVLLGTAPDAGMAAVIAAEKTNANYMFKVVANDLPSGSGATATTFYFAALVMSATVQGGGANTVQMRQVTLEVNSNVVEVAAVAGT